MLRGSNNDGDQQTNGDGTTVSDGTNGASGTGDGAVGESGQPATPIPTVGPTTEVVVSLQTVPRGWQMTANEVSTDTRSIANIGDNVITDINDVIGLYARTDIYQGETLVKDDFVADPRIIGQEDFGPSSTYPIWLDCCSRTPQSLIRCWLWCSGW